MIGTGQSSAAAGAASAVLTGSGGNQATGATSVILVSSARICFITLSDFNWCFFSQSGNLNIASGSRSLIGTGRNSRASGTASAVLTGEGLFGSNQAIGVASVVLVSCSRSVSTLIHISILTDWRVERRIWNRFADRYWTKQSTVGSSRNDTVRQGQLGECNIVGCFVWRTVRGWHSQSGAARFQFIRLWGWGRWPKRLVRSFTVCDARYTCDSTLFIVSRLANGSRIVFSTNRNLLNKINQTSYAILSFCFREFFFFKKKVHESFFFIKVDKFFILQ